MYIAGKRVNQTLNVSGNFELYVGRRLNLEWNRRPAHGHQHVHEYDQHLLELPISRPSPTTSRAKGSANSSTTFRRTWLSDRIFRFNRMLRFRGRESWASRFGNNTYNKLVYSPNTDLQIYGAQRASLFVDNTTTATIRFFPSAPPAQYEVVDNIVISSAKGPVYIDGRGNQTLVTIIPAQFSANDLRSTILADCVFKQCGDADRTRHLDEPACLRRRNDVVLTASTLTGLTGGVIHFDQLTDLLVLRLQL